MLDIVSFAIGWGLADLVVYIYKKNNCGYNERDR